MALTNKQYAKTLEEPALCELLPIRDYLDNVMVRTSGELVAGYALKGAMSYFADDNGRNSTKHHLEALLRTIPEESIRLQFRFEITEDLADLLERYERETKTSSEATLLMEQSRIRMWREKERLGVYLRRINHVYLIWNPEKHRQVLASGGRSMTQGAGGAGFSLSARKQIERTLKEHLDSVSEFESILDGIESALKTAGLDPRRLSDEELFLENKRALAPLAPSNTPPKLYPLSERFITPREQVSVASILNETEDYINIDGVLWSCITLKSPPDATYPGILREIVTAGIPVVVSTQVTVPNQAKVLDAYKKKQKKMAAAQLDQKGNLRVDVTAQVAEKELLQIQHEIISSTLKTCKVSLTIAVRTSRPARTQAQYEEAEREIENRKQQILHIISRMNGARAYPENLAQRRIWITTLPGLADDDRREHDLLTPHAADLLPLEMPWQGTPRSPLMLFASPWRQLLPFSPFDPELSDANILVAAASGHGKSMMTGQMLLQAAKQDLQVSIIERGDSYQNVVEFMNGQMITMSLDSRQTINPWDLAEGEKQPGKDQITFLKNLTRHMLDDSERSDAQLLDIVLVDAIERTYHRAAQRPLNPIPTFGDLRDELQLYQDADKNEKVMEEAKMAAYKMKNWVGNGVYANLFDRHTNLKLDTPWMYFNVEKLKDDPRLEAAMSLLIAWATTNRARGNTGAKSITVLEECWMLLQSPVLAPVVVQLYRTGRKRNSGVWGVSQAVEDFTGTTQAPNEFGAAIVKNTTTKIIGRQTGNFDVLREFLHLNNTTLEQIKSLALPEKGKYSDFVVAIGEKAETTHVFRLVLTPIEYWLLTTFPRERWYRKYWMKKHSDLPVAERYQLLAARFPQGLAALDELPEEHNGEVYEIEERVREAQLRAGGSRR